jgi:putative flippase GtrA
MFKELLVFGLVGVLGFAVDTLVLYILIEGMGPLYARLFSFTAAVFSTWLANRNLTFREKKSHLTKSAEFAAYFGVMLLGGVVNYATYAILVIKYEFVLTNPVIGVAAGSIAGMFVNFFASRLFIFRIQCTDRSKL